MYIGMKPSPHTIRRETNKVRDRRIMRFLAKINEQALNELSLTIIPFGWLPSLSEGHADAPGRHDFTIDYYQAARSQQSPRERFVSARVARFTLYLTQAGKIGWRVQL